MLPPQVFRDFQGNGLQSGKGSRNRDIRHCRDGSKGGVRGAGKLVAQLLEPEADNPTGKYVFINNTSKKDLEDAFADIANQLTIFRRVQ